MTELQVLLIIVAAQKLPARYAEKNVDHLRSNELAAEDCSGCANHVEQHICLHCRFRHIHYPLHA